MMMMMATTGEEKVRVLQTIDNTNKNTTDGTTSNNNNTAKEDEEEIAITKKSIVDFSSSSSSTLLEKEENSSIIDTTSIHSNCTTNDDPFLWITTSKEEEDDAITTITINTMPISNATTSLWNDDDITTTTNSKEAPIPFYTFKLESTTKNASTCNSTTNHLNGTHVLLRIKVVFLQESIIHCDESHKQSNNNTSPRTNKKMRMHKYTFDGCNATSEKNTQSIQHILQICLCRTTFQTNDITTQEQTQQNLISTSNESLKDIVENILPMILNGIVVVSLILINDSTLKVELSLSSEAIHTMYTPTTLPLRTPYLNRPHSNDTTTTTAKILRMLLSILFPKSLIDTIVQQTCTIKQNTSPTLEEECLSSNKIYAMIDNTHSISTSISTKQHAALTIPRLNPILRPYQYAALQWMIAREQIPKEEHAANDGCFWKLPWLVLCDNACIPLYEYAHVPTDLCYEGGDSSSLLYYNPFSGWFFTCVDKVKHCMMGCADENENGAPLRGGILADSMGLGKTVEVLALVLKHAYDDTTTVTPPPPSDTTNILAPLTNEDEDADGVTNAMLSSSDSSSTTKTVKVIVSNTVEAALEYRPYIPTPTPTPTTIPQQIDTLEDINEKTCICGQSNHLCNSDHDNDWVQCPSCLEYLHASCAGYTTPPSSPDNDPFHNCPSCVAAYISKHNDGNTKNHLLSSKATLIIAPSSILDQWIREIRRHISMNDTTFQLLVYPGIKEMCSSTSKKNGIPDISLSHVRNLIHADVILTTFEALMSDFHHTTQSQTTTLRRRKRYRILPSPLPYIKFWRCCLDEAQRVETSTATNCTKMVVQHIHSVNKWCITGTPVGSKTGNMQDLYGLLLFLGIPPFSNDKKWFDYCFTHTYTSTILKQRMIQYLFSLHSFLLRRTKSNAIIKQQMNVPEQKELKVYLKFSSIERHFYNKLLEETILSATTLKEKERHPSSYRNKENVLVSRNILQLRASCCHPQVGSSNTHYFGSRVTTTSNKKRKTTSTTGIVSSNTNGGSIATGVLSMDQILDRLIDDTKTNCEESQRIVVLHSNALASLYRLKVQHRAITPSTTTPTCQQLKLSDKELLNKSIHVYKEALGITNNNAYPCQVVGEATVNGCIGFIHLRNCESVVRDGSTILQWHLKNDDFDSNKENHSSSSLLSSSLENNSDTTVITPREVWAKFDFEGPAKKITAIKVRHVTTIPTTTTNNDSLNSDSLNNDSSNNNQVYNNNNIILLPKKCILQVSNASVGGEFVNACELELPDTTTTTTTNDNEWVNVDGFRTNKSKSWRFVIQTYHHNHHLPLVMKNNTNNSTSSSNANNDSTSNFSVIAVEIQFLEPQIGTDDLQRIHIIHNIAMTLDSLLQIEDENDNIEAEEEEDTTSRKHNNTSTTNSVLPHIHNRDNANKETFHKMNTDLQKLEDLYLRSAHVIHRQSQYLLKQASITKHEIEEEMYNCFSSKISSSKRSTTTIASVVNEVSLWWKDLLSWCSIHQYEYKNEIHSLLSTIREDLFNFTDSLKRQQKKKSTKRNIPHFDDISGLHVALTLRIQDEDIISIPTSESLIQNVKKLSDNPSLAEISQNSQCQTCRKDWFQIGPTCHHCKLDEKLINYEEQLNDLFLDVIFKSLAKSLRVEGKKWNDTKYAIFFSNIKDMSNVYFKWNDARKKELYAAKLAWRTHFDLLSDLDELNQTKTTLRLLRDDECITNFTPFEMNGIVVPSDIPTLMMDHEAKQCMALSQLRRGKDTLRFLRNQGHERKLELQKKKRNDEPDSTSSMSKRDQDVNSTTATDEEAPSCALCLNNFEGERAVLSCGHYFHYSPCLEALILRSGSSGANTSIACPMRCTVRTYKDQIMIATDKSKNDGSRTIREIKGSWGTKVDRLINDVMDVMDTSSEQENQQKSIIFSQWDDMLIIIGKALEVNQIEYVRPKSRSKMGGAINIFCSSDIPVLLLNVKSGAEGLTLVEATHVFMVEPLLHCGLDIQAINRVHRIGQSNTTYVHRYIIKNTIEEKIDKLRMERQNQLLDKDDVEVNNRQKKGDLVSAGGIDGGFSTNELEEILDVS